MISNITLSPEEKGHRFTDNIYKCIFVNGKSCIHIHISLKIVLTDNVGSGNGLGPNSWHAIAWTTDGPILLRWRHNGRIGVSNRQYHDCLLNRLFRRRSKKTSKLRVTGLCVGNSPGTGEFPAQMASNAEIFSIPWRHHAWTHTCPFCKHGLTLIPAWINNHTPRTVCDEITYPFPAFNICTLKFGNV